MEIFVQSRGFSRKHDYRWRKLSDSGCVNTGLDSVPLFYEQEIKPLIDIRSDVFSMVLGHLEQQVFLLVSGLPSSRKDVEKRLISNSAMWISHNFDDDEPTLRKLAIYALRSHISSQSEQLKLEKKLDLVIIGDDNLGFSAKFDQLLPSQLLASTQTRSANELIAQPVEVYSDKKVLELAEDLESNYLPKGERNLVIVTGNKPKAILDNSRVLRGISKFDWAELQTKTVPQQDFSSQIEGAKEGLEGILDKVRRHFFPSLLSVALTAFVLLATPVKHLILTPSLPCPLVPDIEVLNSSRRFVVGEPAVLIGDYDPQKITRVALLDENKQFLGGEAQQIQLLSSDKRWKYIYSTGFQVPGRRRLVLQGFDQSGKMVVEQVVPAIVVSDSSTAGDIK